jgi:hypothetical protein
MPKFGDIVINEWASNRNPNKVLMFVKSYARRVVCLSLEGDEVVFGKDKDLRLTVQLPAVENHLLIAWQRIARGTYAIPDPGAPDAD